MDRQVYRHLMACLALLISHFSLVKASPRSEAGPLLSSRDNMGAGSIRPEALIGIAIGSVFVTAVIILGSWNFLLIRRQRLAEQLSGRTQVILLPSAASDSDLESGISESPPIYKARDSIEGSADENRRDEAIVNTLVPPSYSETQAPKNVEEDGNAKNASMQNQPVENISEDK